MEYVGSRVKKVLETGVTLFGIVQAFLAYTGIYQILYENGHSEEMTLPELLSSLVTSPPPSPNRRRRSSTSSPSKRRRLIDLNEPIGEEEEGEGSSKWLIDLNVDFNQQQERFTRDFDLNVEATEEEDDDECGIILPPKVELPSSSRYDPRLRFDKGGVVSFVDVLFVYAFLRSFGCFLFLSPFLLNDFIDCIVSTDSTYLFDSIHVSLLRALRGIHPSLPGSLNWDLIDLITWPVFLVEHLSHNGSGVTCSYPLEQSHYYELRVSEKIMILQELCDDVVRTVKFSSELNRRSKDYQTELDRNAKFQSSETGKASMDVASTSESSDCNNDECYLCKMVGNLICCDGCSETFHSRCVGVTGQLPEGEWYCPECSIDNFSMPRNSLRGMELLGDDPHGRSYYAISDYLLVLESYEDKCSSWCYKKNDLPTLIEALKSSPFIYDTIIIAIKKWVVSTGDHCTSSANITVEQGSGINSAYVNLYEYAHTTSLVPENLTHETSKEKIIMGQAKVVLNRFAEFSWSNIRNSNVNVRKEKCGWCFYCKNPENDRDCLFVMNDIFPVIETFTSDELDIGSRKKRKNHLIDVMCHVICIEAHLGGLLAGPWLNPQFSQHWRECVLGVSDLASIKNLVLEVESNLHHLALSAGWRKPVKYVHIMACSGVSAKHGTRRKRSKPSELKINTSSNVGPTLNFFWWRGVRASRNLFSFKVLPCSLALKAARQGGCKKIPGVCYPEYTAWRNSVATSRSVEQLALQIRELDANIRWDVIGNNNLLSMRDIVESDKHASAFKEAKICNKSSNDTVSNYLLDFGECNQIPKVVKDYGSPLDDLSSEGKQQFWLEESLVPLYLLKSFEQKRIIIAHNNANKNCKEMRKPKIIKKKGIEYLFSRAKKLENYQCGLCKEDVLISVAVSCVYCGGFFHSEHARKLTGSITAGYKYSCHKCEERVPLQIKSVKKLKKTKIAKSKDPLKKWALRKKRTAPQHSSYWLKGFRLTKKKIHERGIDFRRKHLVLPGEEGLLSCKQECSLCNTQEYSTDLSYLSCELCGVSFHGDAVELTDETIEYLVGYRCYKCLDKKPPICPHSFPTGGMNMAAKISQMKNILMLGLRKQKSKNIMEINYVFAMTWCVWNETNWQGGCDKSYPTQSTRGE